VQAAVSADKLAVTAQKAGIIGGALGGVLAGLLAGGLAYLLVRRCRRCSQPPSLKPPLKPSTREASRAVMPHGELSDIEAKRSSKLPAGLRGQPQPVRLDSLEHNFATGSLTMGDVQEGEDASGQGDAALRLGPSLGSNAHAAYHLPLPPKDAGYRRTEQDNA
jgi:hypothetical protein